MPYVGKKKFSYILSDTTQSYDKCLMVDFQGMRNELLQEVLKIFTTKGHKLYKNNAIHRYRYYRFGDDITSNIPPRQLYHKQNRDEQRLPSSLHAITFFSNRNQAEPETIHFTAQRALPPVTIWEGQISHTEPQQGTK